MGNPRNRDPFERIELRATLQREWEIVAMYEHSLAKLRKRIKGEKYEPGTLDERLRGDSE